MEMAKIAWPNKQLLDYLKFLQQEINLSNLIYIYYVVTLDVNKYEVELAYNVVKGTEYFVSL